MPRVEPACCVGPAVAEAMMTAIKRATLGRPVPELPAWVSAESDREFWDGVYGAVEPELPHERNARLRREAVEGEEVQP